MTKNSEKMPLGLKILVGFWILGLIGTINVLMVASTSSALMAMAFTGLWSVIESVVGIVLGGIVPIMSAFNRKLLFWKVSFGYMIFRLILTGVLVFQAFTVSATVELLPRSFVVGSYAIGIIVSVIITGYYYSKKSYFDKK